MNSAVRLLTFLRQAILPLLALTWMTATCQAQDSTFHLEIQRKYSSKECISGYLIVNGKVVCYVLERPWEN